MLFCYYVFDLLICSCVPSVASEHSSSECVLSSYYYVFICYYVIVSLKNMFLCIC